MSDEGPVSCYKCHEECTKDYIKAMGHSWHVDHFVCCVCEESLNGKSFFEHEDAGYCRDCFQKKCAPKCGCCGEGIIGDVTTALGKTWMPAHFVCTECKKLFEPGEGFLEKDGMPYCKPDFYELFKPKCSKCEKPIPDKTVTALEKKWHPGCFVCNKCGEQFADGRFFVVNDLPYCAQHKHGDRPDQPDDIYAQPDAE
ncbi:transforming growth factor beta-1-induced transcript 1 protein-like [Sycon ciliatum]|uniref:transforming growth factor beta-1-induced transcript 1 protein-like n=1 Tax=Sycon ciliatum TaxID=27933 RepID=UPI0031F6C1BC